MLAFDNTAAARGWALLVLAGVGPRAFLAFDIGDGFRREAFRPGEIAVFGPRVVPADGVKGFTAALEFHRHHQMTVGPGIFEDEAGDIELVDALHDDDDGAIVEII